MERLTERCALERWTSRETVEPEKFVMVRGKTLGRAYFESDNDYKNYCDALEKLATYEDLEEQGRLVVLPCKVGTVVWSSVLTEIDDDGVEHVAPWSFVPGMMDEWGKSFFLTRAEAEKAMEVSEDA